MTVNIGRDPDPYFRIDFTDQEMIPVVAEVERSIAQVSAHCVAYNQKPVDNVNVLLGNYFFSGGFDAPNTIKVSTIQPDIEIFSAVTHELCHFRRHERLGNKARSKIKNTATGNVTVIPGIYAVEEGFALLFEVENGRPKILDDRNWPADCNFAAAISMAIDLQDLSMKEFRKQRLLDDPDIGLAIVAGYLEHTGKKVVETFDVSYEQVLDNWRKGKFDVVTTRERLLHIISP